MKDIVATIPEIRKHLDEAAEVTQYLWQKGWAERNGGNFSIDVTDAYNTLNLTKSGRRVAFDESFQAIGERSYLISGTGKRLRDVAKDVSQNACIININEAGDAYRIVWSGDDLMRPTSEISAHLMFHSYAFQNDLPFKAMLHTHPNEIAALTLLSEYAQREPLVQSLYSAHSEIMALLPEGIGFVPYLMPGSISLAKKTLQELESGVRVVVWKNHGALGVGESLIEAFDAVDIINKAARLLLLALSTGKKIEGLSEENLAELHQAFSKK